VAVVGLGIAAVVVVPVTHELADRPCERLVGDQHTGGDVDG